MAEPVEICTGLARIVGNGKAARLQQEWQIYGPSGAYTTEWRDVPTVAAGGEEAGGGYVDTGGERQENS